MFHKGFQDYGNIFTFYTDALRHNVLFTRANKLMRYARGYFLISKLIKYTSVAVAFVETSATLIVISSVLLALIPLFILTAAVLTVVSLSQFKRYDGELEPIFAKGGNIMFIYTGRGYSNKRAAFLRGMANGFADGGYTVFVVSRPIFRDGTGGTKKIRDGLWVVKLNYFYIMKRRFLKGADKSKMTFIQ